MRQENITLRPFFRDYLNNNLYICNVYGLYSDKDANKAIRYIGVTTSSIEIRLNAHLTQTSNKIKDKWISDNKDNIKYISFATEITIKQANQLEIDLINRMDYLVNGNDGGYRLSDSILIDKLKKARSIDFSDEVKQLIIANTEESEIKLRFLLNEEKITYLKVRSLEIQDELSYITRKKEPIISNIERAKRALEHQQRLKEMLKTN
jgi:hypothetical protein